MHPFDKDITVKKELNGFCPVTVSDRWCINNTPNGGYIMALLLQAMSTLCSDTSTPILTTNFIARIAPGAAVIIVERIAQSRQFDRILAKLVQNDAIKVMAWATFYSAVDTSFTRYEGTAPDLEPLDTCMKIPEMPSYTLYSHMDVFLEPGCAGWFQGNLSHTSEHRGYIRFKSHRIHDLHSAALCSDAFPPPIFASQGPVAWVPTIEFTLNIRNIPESPVLKCRFRTRYVSHGMCEEDGELRCPCSEKTDNAAAQMIIL